MRKTGFGYVISWTVSKAHFISKVRVKVSLATEDSNATVYQYELSRHVRAFLFSDLEHGRRYQFEVAVKAYDTYGPPAVVERDF